MSGRTAGSSAASESASRCELLRQQVDGVDLRLDLTRRCRAGEDRIAGRAGGDPCRQDVVTDALGLGGPGVRGGRLALGLVGAFAGSRLAVEGVAQVFLVARYLGLHRVVLAAEVGGLGERADHGFARPRHLGAQV